MLLIGLSISTLIALLILARIIRHEGLGLAMIYLAGMLNSWLAGYFIGALAPLGHLF